MSTYQVICDEGKMREFIAWLPDTEQNTKYYCCLFARKKYCKNVPWIKSDKGQLKRFISDKARLFEKIEQLECKLGAYKLNGEAVPQEALALYITPNPRDLEKATMTSIKKLVDLKLTQAKNCNPHQEILSEIQRTAAKKTLISFDIDVKDEQVLQIIRDIALDKCNIIETRGGYHIHVHRDVAEELSKTNRQWYNQIKVHADITGDAMTPVVGSYQGGFVPTFKQIYILP